MVEYNDNIKARVYEEDEIDLKELFNTILKSKKTIFLITSLFIIIALVFALSKPNVYESKTILVPQESGKMNVGGGLAALAGIAGVDLNQGTGVKPEHGYSALLNDFSFMQKFILTRNLQDRFLDPKLSENYKFAFGFDTIYKVLNVTDGEKTFDNLNEMEKQEAIFDVAKVLKEMINISSDNKTSLITISAKHPDANLAKDVVEYFLLDASNYLRDSEMEDNDKKIRYYEEALSKTYDIALKSKLAELGSALIQKKVLANSSDLYNIKQLTKPEVAFYKDKVGPKRALILVVAAVTGFILSIFLVFFLEFIKKEDIIESKDEK